MIPHYISYKWQWWEEEQRASLEGAALLRASDDADQKTKFDYRWELKEAEKVCMLAVRILCMRKFFKNVHDSVCLHRMNLSMHA